MFSSLISLEDSTYSSISQQVIDDLNLTETFEHLLEINEGEEAIVYQLCQDVATVEFRQSIMKDFTELPGLLDELVEQLKAFGHHRFKFEKKLDETSRLYFLIELLVIVEASVACLEELYQTLCYYDIRSVGLVSLKSSVEKMMTDDLYKHMKEDRKAIRHIFSRIKSVEVSINMNTGMRPYEAQITQVNEHRYRYPHAFRKVSDALEVTDMYLGKQTRHYAPLFPIDRVNLDLLEEIEYALRDYKDDLTRFLNTYNKLDAQPFIRLHEEVTFYKAGMDLYLTLTRGGLWMSFPKVADHGDNYLSVKEAYNLHLGEIMIYGGMPSNLVANDLNLKKGEVMLITGANRGGKTTFTQMIGQLQVLALLGFPIPAREAEMSVCDRIASHFPVIEQAAVDYGRFGRACFEFKEVFGDLSHGSLMLMNESFSGTSHLESIEIASEVVKALVEKGITTVYNTHLHELYSETKTFGHVRSCVVADTESPDVYKVTEGDPLGYSHALAIAQKYGVTYEQLVAQLGGDEVET